MTFGPALSLGVASLDEYLDVKLIDAPEPDVLIDRLASVASQGLRFVAARRLADADANVSALITSARYLVAFAHSSLARLGGTPGLEALVAAFLAKAEHRVRRDVGGVGKIVDVRHFTQNARVGGAAEQTLLEKAGLIGDLVPLELTISVGASGSAKIAEVVEAIIGEPGFPHRAVRTALLASGASPLDITATREPVQAQPQAG
jgi:hypothetical protein